MAVELHDNAVLKAFQHAYRFRSDEVVGLLLGTKENDVYKVLEVLPVAHREMLGTASATTLAMTHKYVELRNRENEEPTKLSILGVYYFPVNDCLTRAGGNALANATIGSLLKPIARLGNDALLLKGDFKDGKVHFEYATCSKDASALDKFVPVTLGPKVDLLVRKCVASRSCEEVGDIELFFVEPAVVEDVVA